MLRKGGQRARLARLVLLASLLAGLLAALTPAASQATIHPIVASFCAEVAGTNANILDPPGQTPTNPDPNTWTVSNLRALQATGVLTLVRDSAGNVIGFTVDLSRPPVKGSDFPAFVSCTNLNP